jgi:DNA mismatch repair ATPase MutS
LIYATYQLVFQHLETYPLRRYDALNDLCQPFLDTENRPSAKLKQVSFLTAAAGLTQNPFIGLVLNLIAPWNLYFAHRLNLYKEEVVHQLPQWLDALFELEALGSLANFAYLNPGYAFPIITNYELGMTNDETISGQRSAVSRQLFNAKGLGHPLIPAGQKVCNDFSADRPGQVVIITGSNMAGKSSFLRTVGVNLCLACAGGPVNAQSCRTIPFRLFTALSVSDSVTDGISYFYAEVKRLKRLLDTLNADDPLPLMHLVDEIFRGTNNRERFIGSRAYIRTLVGGNGFGIIATHDLELVKLADELSGVKNYHFREEVVAGKMVFDYQLRSGPCPTTNALKIMQAEGLVNDEW